MSKCKYCGADEGEWHMPHCRNNVATADQIDGMMPTGGLMNDFNRDLSASIDKLIRERDEARAEAHEQARLLGMSAERELKLMAEVERLRTEYHETLQMAANQASTIKQQIEEIERLRELLDQCAAELTSIYESEYASRDIYPDMQRRYDRDMSLVRDIRAAIDAAMRKGGGDV